MTQSTVIEQVSEQINEPIKLIVSELNGKKIAYHSQTTFTIQVGRYKGAYKNRATFTGNLAQAVMHYNMINIGNGYKKRLIWSGNDHVLARQLS